MAKINSKYAAVEFDTPAQVIKDLGLNPTGDVQTFVTNRARDRMQKYVPMDTGNLIDSGGISFNPPGVSYDTPYAEKMYYGVSPSGKPINYNGEPQRGAFWDEIMMAVEGNQLEKEINEFVDKKRQVK